MPNADNPRLSQSEAAQIGAELGQLESRLGRDNPHFRDFWSHVRQVNELLKQSPALQRDERQALFERLGQLCERAKAMQVQRHKEFDRRQSVSEHKRGLVESKIRDAEWQIKASSSGEEFTKAGELLREALQWMKNGWAGFNVPTQAVEWNDGKMLRGDHDACWARWQEVNELLRARRQEVGEFNFGEFERQAYEAVQEASYDPKRAKEHVREVQNSIRNSIMSKFQFGEIHRLLDRAWEEASEALRRRHSEWEDHQRSKIDRKRELIEQSENLIERLEKQIDRCREMEADAKTDDFAETVRGWIDEKLEIIAQKRGFIEVLEEQIRDIERRLG
jgi:hypothetical protein